MTPFPPSKVPFGPSLWIAARLLPTFTRRPLDEILKLATPARDDFAYEDLSPEKIIEAVQRSVAHPWRMRGRRCLREGLLAFRYLMLADHRPKLHFGLVAKTALSPTPRAHCWVSVGGRTMLNPPTEPMLDLFIYDGRNAAPPSTLPGMAVANHD